MSSPTNIYHYIMENHEAIDSIPDLVTRLKSIEEHLGIVYFPGGGWALRSALVTDTEEATFDQGDHDELFADGGATERSWDQADWDELFGEMEGFDQADWDELFGQEASVEDSWEDDGGLARQPDEPTGSGPWPPVRS